jgi:nitrogen fixation protein NifX
LAKISLVSQITEDQANLYWSKFCRITYKCENFGWYVKMTTLNDCIASCVSDNSDLIVAFASQEGDIVDQHFGSALGFFVYAVNKDATTFVGSKLFGREDRDGNEDKLKPKMSFLVGSDVVYCGSIGGSATRQLVSLGITPMKVEGGPDIEELLTSLQNQLRGQAEFWLANLLKQKQKANSGADRFALDEEWG